MKYKQILSLLCAAWLGIAPASLPIQAETGTETKYIALTFDDGPNTHTTPKVLDILEEYDAKASFFLIGDKITEDSAVVMKRAYAMGCEINSHSRTHAHMTEMTEAEIRAEMAYVDDYVFSVTGDYPQFFRPPYLEVNQTMYDAIDIPFITGYSSGDSAADATAETIAEKVLSIAKDGAIVLMHDYWGNDRTVEALGTILPELTAQGYEFVTVSELFAIKGEIPEEDCCYYEVNEHPCGKLTFAETLLDTPVTGTNDWEGWKEAILLDPQRLAAEETFSLEVTYDSENPPVVVLHRWKSAEDNLWEAVKPAYDNGRKACFRSSDLQAVLDQYGMDYTDMGWIMVRPYGTDMTISQVDLYTEQTQGNAMGDVDLDGSFTLADIILFQKWMLGTGPDVLEGWEHADFSGDGRLNGFDMAMMKRAYFMEVQK